MKNFSRIGFIGLALLLLLPCSAFASDPLIEGAKLCTQHLPRFEREYAIPTHLLSAIASTESGRYHEGLRLKLPWPWTINTGGKGYFFNSKEEAIEAVKKLHARGVQSIDVGCMQVNLYHHPDAFSSLDQAFEPQTNIAYAAGFLRSLYDTNGTWKKAASDYHSKTAKLGRIYVDQVYDSWFTIIERLREARLHVPESAIAGMNDMKYASLSPSSGAKIISVAKSTRKDAREGKHIEVYNHPHMNEIKVTSVKEDSGMTSHRENDIIVFRPDAAQPEVKPEIRTADSASIQTATPASVIQSAPASDADLKLTPVSDQHTIGTQVTEPHKSGPNFIFND